MPSSTTANTSSFDASPVAVPSMSSSLHRNPLLSLTKIKGFRAPPTLLSTTHTVSQSSKHRERENGSAARSQSSHHATSADGAVHSLNYSFGNPSLPFPLDEEQRRCVNTAFHISFRGNPRVKHKPTCVELPNGVSFLIVDRFVSGNSDGVYEKNRKMWEQIPVGQARIFARCCSAGDRDAAVCRDAVGNDGQVERSHSYRTPSAKGSVPTGVATSPVSPISIGYLPMGDWSYVGTAVGLRKMGHWREATTVYALHKEAAKTAMALEKVDGEAGQVSAFSYGGERYWIIGCRYQHIVTRLHVSEADLVRYVAGGGGSTTSSSSSTDSGAENASSALGGGPRLDSSPLTSPTHHTGQPASLITLGDGSTTSEGAYMDLAVRMARLWRRLLESLPVAELEDVAALLTGTSVLPSPSALPLNPGGESQTPAIARLHEQVSHDQRSLCFDAILTGWERLQSFSAVQSLTSAASSSSSSIGSSTPLTAALQVRTATSTNLHSVHSLAASQAALTQEEEEGGRGEPEEIPLWFYAITYDRPIELAGWCMPMRRAFDFFAAAQLPVVPPAPTVELGSSEFEAARQSVLCGRDSAGAVFYGSSACLCSSGSENNGREDNEDGAETVVQIWKCRSYPHTLERVVQEYVVTHRLCGDALRNKIKKKMSSLPRDTRLCVRQWELHRLPFLVDFALWLHREKHITSSTDLAALRRIRGHWLSHQESFKEVLLAQLQRQQQRLSARPSSLSALDFSRRDELQPSFADEPNGRALIPAAPKGDEEEENAVDAVMLVGPQGCGKSTMARILYALLEEAGAAPRWLNQDEVGTRSAYLAALRRAMQPGTYTHVLLDKMNLDEKTRADYAELGVAPVLVVTWTHPGGTEAMIATCCDRVVQRGACHRSFVPDSSPDVRPSYPAISPLLAPATSSPSPSASRLHSIVEGSLRRYQVPTALPCVSMDLTWDSAHAVQVVWAALRERGTCELPPLEELDLIAARRCATDYERLLETYPSRVLAAVLRGPSAESLLLQLGADHPPVVPKTQRLQPHIEVLLHDLQQQPSPTVIVRYATQIGSIRPLTVQAVVTNAKVTLLLLLGPSEGAAAVASGSSRKASAVSVASPTLSQEFDDYVLAQRQQEQWAVVAKAKKVSVEYCEELAQRVRDDPEEDPYCAVQWLSPPLTLDFTLAFVFA